MATAQQFVQRLAEVVPGDKMDGIMEQQDECIARLTSTESELRAFNSFSASRFDGNAARVDAHVNMLRTLKSDLENVFKRVRLLKARVAAKLPTQYQEHMQRMPAELDD
ncbi:KxDL motif-containing protein 1 [Chytriomyces hyalinus]|nr:KxDL motif-containing protein 1 [Chytriomyces hyalinus]KAJ3267182.1 KxDL motif-containing protein 1 [Chytriomyces hyalinus]KAJ3402267.1 KxDL motif-containing protein 1 [Chytriomyces hyalinus]